MTEQPTSKPAPPAKEYFPPRVQSLGTLAGITRGSGGSGLDGDVSGGMSRVPTSIALLKYDVQELD